VTRRKEPGVCRDCNGRGYFPEKEISSRGLCMGRDEKRKKGKSENNLIFRPEENKRLVLLSPAD